jgi:hypothetical protein
LKVSGISSKTLRNPDLQLAVEIRRSADRFLNGKTVSCTLITNSGGMDTLRSKLKAQFTAFTISTTKPIAQIEYVWLLA